MVTAVYSYWKCGAANGRPGSRTARRAPRLVLDNQVISAQVGCIPLSKKTGFRSTGGKFSLHQAGPTTAIDLERWNAETASIATLEKGRRSDLNFARRHSRLTWTSEEGRWHDDLQLFHELYEQRMTGARSGRLLPLPIGVLPVAGRRAWASPRHRYRVAERRAGGCGAVHDWTVRWRIIT